MKGEEFKLPISAEELKEEIVKGFKKDTHFSLTITEHDPSTNKLGIEIKVNGSPISLAMLLAMATEQDERVKAIFDQMLKFMLSKQINDLAEQVQFATGKVAKA